MQPPHFKPSQNERLLLVVRQSPLRLVIALLGPALLIIGAFFMLFPLFARGTIGIVIFSAALIVGCGWLIRSLAVWYYRSLTVTTKRIIDVDQQKLFRRTVSDVPLDSIHDVYYQVRGLGQAVGRSGTVYIVLTDQKTRIQVAHVSRPHNIQRLILQLRSEIIRDRLDTTTLSAEELIALVRQIKAGLGEARFKKILSEDDAKKT